MSTENKAGEATNETKIEHADTVNVESTNGQGKTEAANDTAAGGDADKTNTAE